MNTLASAKRTRGHASSIEGSSGSGSSSPTATKALRLTRAEAAPLFCSLPPTCNPPHNERTALANVMELEAHYATYHAHVCEEKGCAAVFPNARLLELHQTECHDPIALLRKERGEKIFACHLESCTRKFLDPKKRRLHLVQAHGYPKEYFFAVTNKGVGGLLKKWGEGASMIRGAWRARDGQPEGDGVERVDIEDADGGDVDEGEDSMDEEMLSTGTVKNSSNPINSLPKRAGTKKLGTAQATSKVTSSTKAADTSDTGVEDLANSMSSLSLVPSSIRFGRGGKSIRVARRMRSDSKEEKYGQNLDRRSESATRDERLPLENAESGIGGDISINIDGALEALKFEAPPLNISARTITQANDTGTNRAPMPGRRARGGGRGRGRGPGRGHGRGRD